MRETSFIKQNQEKWKEFENLLEMKVKDPDKLSELYVQVTDDLSYSRTFYPNRSVRVYLNGLAQQLFYKIYKNKKSNSNAFVNFWKTDLPRIVYLHRKAFYLSLFVFGLSLFIGAFSSTMDQEFPTYIMGESYISMTEENIASGDPMAVYKKQNEMDMFLGITLNNLKVAFLTFIFGLFFAIGSIGILIKNGVMVGAFQWFFYDVGLFQESFLTIWIHGTIEISSIIIAGAAGIVMGSGLVFPGTYSRLHAFRVSGRHGLKIMLGIVPLIVLAGFFEGFFTRYTEAPDLLRAGFILASLFLILSYFVWYPYMMAKNGLIKEEDAPKLPADKLSTPDYQKIKGNGEIFMDTLTFIKRHFMRFFGFTLLSSLAYGASVFVYRIYNPYLPEQGFTIIGNTFASGFAHPIITAGYFAAVAIFMVWIAWFLERDYKGTDWTESIRWKPFSRFFLRNILQAVVILALVSLVYYAGGYLPQLLSFIVLPLAFLWLFIAQKEKIPFFQAMGRMFSVANSSWGKVLSMSAVLGLFGLGLSLLVNSQYFWLYYTMITESLFYAPETVDSLQAFMQPFMFAFIQTFILGLHFVGFSFLYYSLKEIKDAASLKERIPHIGDRSMAFGLESERVNN